MPVNASSSASSRPTATRPASGASRGGDSHDNVVAASHGTSGATESAGSCATCGIRKSCRCTISQATAKLIASSVFHGSRPNSPSSTHAAHRNTRPNCFHARWGAEGETVSGSAVSGTTGRGARNRGIWNGVSGTKKAAEAAFRKGSPGDSRQADAPAPLPLLP